MKKFLKISLIFVACLVVAGFIGKYFLLDRGPIPAESTFTIDMDEVRRLAAADNAGLPVEVRSLVVAKGTFPARIVIAGAGGGEIPMTFASYQVVYPDKTVVIDSCADKASFEAMPFAPSDYSDENYKVLQESLKKASLVLITHEHYDHIGGVATSPYINEILPRLLLTTEQVESPLMKDAGFPTGALDGYTPLSYDRYYSPAPGIVLIKAPGHAPGQQIIYVRTKDGREYLFVGDIVWSRENLKREVNRPLLMSLVMNEDLEAARGEIRWIIDDLYKNPNNAITYVVSHDGEQLVRIYRGRGHRSRV